MRTPTLRRLAVPALAAVLVLAGCSDDGGDDDADATTTEAAEEETSTTAADDPTTTAGDEATSTTEADDEDDEGDETTTTEDDASPGSDPEAPDEGQEGVGAPDEEAPDVSWDLNAAQYRGEDGKLVAFRCPPDGEIGSVWGTETYTDDSSVCSAAVHAGIINPVEGGRVVIEIAPGEGSYEGSEANGVTSQEYGEWAGSFTFPVG